MNLKLDDAMMFHWRNLVREAESIKPMNLRDTCIVKLPIDQENHRMSGGLPGRRYSG